MRHATPDEQRVYQIAREHFGYERLRPGQQAALLSVLQGHDTLAVLPTGSGKSAIYQIAALLLPGSTVVVSPLIALQQDQAQSIELQDVGGAAVINSTIPQADRSTALTAASTGDIEFIFLAPEQFSNPEVLEKLQAAKPSLFVVDEAHCISQWGHDFRPDYLRLGGVIEALGHPAVLALTATASPPVRAEILERLGMRSPRTVVRGFDRPNIWLGVASFFGSEEEKRRALLERVTETEKPGIVYAATRRHAEEVAAALNATGVAAAHYHAGMTAEERERVHQAFLADDIAVIAATSAFGMGIDKPNVRFVFHYDITDSLDSYYQEIGRAGRDGQQAWALLFYRPEDLGLRRFFAGQGSLEPEVIERVAEVVQEHDGPVAPRALTDEMELSETKLATVVNRLEEAGAVERLPTGEVVSSDEPPDLHEAAQEAADAQERRQQLRRSQVAMMQRYAEERDCRRAALLSYFGEDYPAPCGACDNCEAGRSTAVQDQAGQPFPADSRVRHRAWGEGVVLRVQGDTLTVLFDDVGYKTLSVELVLDRNLLERVA